MSSYCHTCGRPFPTPDEFDHLVGGYAPDKYYGDFPYEWWQTKAEVGKTYDVPGLGDVELVAREYEYPDGYETNDTFLIFRIDGELYKKTGTVSSYNGSEWDGPFKTTQIQTRQVEYYS